ncbi:MAG: DUF4238 domain-containing protein [Anaerolineae bacterium]|nr:DUF4238 domain-containing protein [Anaerolineae bacterium]
MSRAVKQHYVPQFYLKRFTQDSEQLFVFDKFTKTSFRTNIGNIAGERCFYDIPPGIVAEDVDPQIVEKTFSELETYFSNAVDDLLRTVDAGKKIDSDQKQDISLLIMIQYFRTPEFRTLYTALVEQGAKALLDMMVKIEMPGVSPDKYYVRLDEKKLLLEQAMFMFDPTTLNVFVRALTNHIWLVGVNETRQPLYTSDSPVVKKAHTQHPPGFASEGIEIAFPITPKHVLVLCERTFFRTLAKLDCRSVSLKAGNVTYYNSLQVFQSYRQIYCPSDKFSLARKICKKHPEVCTPGRTRFQIHMGEGLDRSQ